MADTGSFYARPPTSPAREAFDARLALKHAAPLWNVLGDIVPPRPQPACVPALWRYDDMRPLLMEAGTLITAAEAERRVLMLENPGLRGASRVTQSLYAGLQLILPGEVAASHRHAASALRLVLEGEGAYTTVDGTRVTMRFGDLILTPSWSYHDHGNAGQTPVVWMDGLDIPIVNMFDASFAEHGFEGAAPAAAPDSARSTPSQTPSISHPYKSSRETLDRLTHTTRVHPCHGICLRFTHPETGGAVMPTLDARLQLLPAGFRGLPYRSTDSTVFCAIEGAGKSVAGGSSLDWHARDIFVVPSWRPVSHEVDREAVLFSFSDRPIQKALGLWREQEGLDE